MTLCSAAVGTSCSPASPNGIICHKIQNKLLGIFVEFNWSLSYCQWCMVSFILLLHMLHVHSKWRPSVVSLSVIWCRVVDRILGHFCMLPAAFFITGYRCEATTAGNCTDWKRLVGKPVTDTEYKQIWGHWTLFFKLLGGRQLFGKTSNALWSQSFSNMLSQRLQRPGDG